MRPRLRHRELGSRGEHAVALLLGVLLAACTAPTPVPTTSPTATSTAAPRVETAVEANIVPSSTPGEWLVVGIARNPTPTDVQRPGILIVLRSPSGVEIARRTVNLPLDRLHSGGAWPFQEAFRPPQPPASAEAVLQGVPGDPSSMAPVSAQVLRVFPDEAGRLVALGSITNPGDTPVRIETLRLAGHDPEGAALRVVEARPGKAGLAPGAMAPFLALLPSAADGLAWEPYPIARQVELPPPDAEIIDTRPYLDDQGNPFMTAVIESRSPQPIHLRLTGVAVSGGSWLAAKTFDLPAPLAPGSRSAQSLLLPVASLGPTATNEIDWVLTLETEPAGFSPDPVPVEVVGYEHIGSSLVMRLRLSDPGGAGVAEASAGVALRSPAGRIVSAGWVSLPDLAPGGAGVAVLVLPLPRGIDLTRAEFEVWGSGRLGGG